MNEKKGDYVAVPTTDSTLPAPAACPHGNDCCKKRRNKAKRFAKFFLIGGSIALLALSKFNGSHYEHHQLDNVSPFDIEPSKLDFGLPKRMGKSDQMKELTDFMQGLQAAYGEHHPRMHGPPPMPPHGGPPHPPPPGDDTPFPHPPPPGDDAPFPHPPPPGDHPPFSHPPGDDAPFPHPPPHDERPGGQNYHGKHHGKHQHHHRHGGHKNNETQLQEPQALDLPPPPPPRVCLPNTTLEATSTVYTFSPEEFKRAAVYVGRGFPEGGKVFLSKSISDDTDIKVNVTVLYEKKRLGKQVLTTAFDHDGQYVVEVRRQGRPHHPPPHHRPHCLTYEVNVVFPAGLESYEDLELKIREGFLGSCPSLKSLEFEEFSAGIGSGFVHFGALSAKKAKIASLNGGVTGDFYPSEAIATGVVFGFSDINIHPVDEEVKITGAAVRGDVKAAVDAEAYEGKFVIHSAFGETPFVSAPEPTDLHIEKYKHDLKAGYYKSKDTESKILLNAKHGATKLNFVSTN